MSKAWSRFITSTDTINKLVLIEGIYKNQKNSSIKRNHRKPEYSKEELQSWCISQTIFHELYNEWKQSDFEHLLRPSVDRKHDDIHYCMKNIQLMTLGENIRKQRTKNKKHFTLDEQKEIVLIVKSFKKGKL